MSSKEKILPHKGITRIQCICCPKIFKSHLTFLEHLTDVHKKFIKTNKLKIITNKHFETTHIIEFTEDHIENPYIYFYQIFLTHMLRSILTKTQLHPRIKYHGWRKNRLHRIVRNKKKYFQGIFVLLNQLFFVTSET